MVYVDEPVVYAEEPAGYGGRKRAVAAWCHMASDSGDEELHSMARRLGLRREWAQVSNSGLLHYDLVSAKRKLALRYGAKALDRRSFARLSRAIREGPTGTPTIGPSPPRSR